MSVCYFCGNEYKGGFFDFPSVAVGPYQLAYICPFCTEKRINIIKKGLLDQKKKEPEIEKVKQEIRKNKHNAGLYFKLGNLLMPSNMNEMTIYTFEEFHQKIPIKMTFDAFHKAVVLGLNDLVQRGTAYSYLTQLEPYIMYIRKYSPSLQSEYMDNALEAFELALSFDLDNMDVLEAVSMIYNAMGQNKKETKILAHIQEVKQKKKLGLTANIRKSPISSSQKGIVFEQKCLIVVKSLGFSAQTTKAGADGGLDIVAISNEILTRGKYIIQCKNWSKPVGEPVVRDLYGIVASSDAIKGILIATSGFTSTAERFAQGKRLELIDGSQLDHLYATYSDENQGE